MAKILSPIIDVGSGSVAGITFTRTREHQVVMRQRTVPVNPNTVNQIAVRNGFAQAASDWETTFGSNRTAWEAYADTLTWYTKLGNAFTPTGRAAFIQVRSLLGYLDNQNLLAYVARMTPGDEPGSFNIPMPVVGALAAPGIGFQLTFANNQTHSVGLYVRRAISISNGTNYFKGPYDPSTGSVITVVTEDEAVASFTGLIDGARYPWIARPFTADFPTHGMRLAPVLSGIATAEETVV